MEFRRATVPQVYFYLPTPDTIVHDATFSINGSEPVALAITEEDETKVSAILPYLNSEGRVEIVWSIEVPGSGTFEETEVHEVVTPFLERREVKEFIAEFTDKQLDGIEASVRHIIYSLTGQTFGKFVGTHSVHGTEGLLLHLPQRLLRLESVNGVVANDYFTIESGGWSLRHFPWGVPPVKADFFGLHQHVGGVIHNPNNVRLGEFYKTATYDIDGVWGYHAVPEAIKEAARLLINDYSCADAEYRDRYLTSMTAADWRIQFNDAAFSSTGNARADKLIEPYVLKNGWTVI